MAKRRADRQNDSGHGGGRPRVPGYELKINKKKNHRVEWKTVKPGTRGSKPDSYLHRYARVIGFKLPEQDHADVEGNVNVAAAMKSLRELTGDVKNRINSQADFECFVSRQGVGTSYHSFLKSLKEPFDPQGNLQRNEPIQVCYVPPTHSLVMTWLLYLRNDRRLAYGAIEALLSGLSATNGQYWGVSIDRKKMKDVLKQWKEEDICNG